MTKVKGKALVNLTKRSAALSAEFTMRQNKKSKNFELPQQRPKAPEAPVDERTKASVNNIWARPAYDPGKGMSVHRAGAFDHLEIKTKGTPT